MGAPASPQVIGRYTIYGKIASGGMASVHYGRLAGAAGFARTVAIKRLHTHLAEDPEFLSTMIDEARLAARIHHPNVVPTLDVVAEGGELLVVMEYVRGESLARVLKTELSRGRRVPLPIASAIIIGALHGLHAAHEAKTDRGAPLGIVHRDVSPQNILVGVDGAARVIDFGVAKAAGRLQTTREGVVKGKMAYMSPEQLASGEVTRAADIYAMGVVLWETLAGKRLFQGESDAQLVLKVMAGAEHPPSRHAPDLPHGLDALVMTALALDPEDRFRSAEAMAEMLLRVVPPAFPTTVGKWVEEVAADALARRATELADIESSTGLAEVAVASGAPGTPALPPRRADGGASGVRPAAPHIDDAPTIASQPSSLSVETPARSFAGLVRSPRAKVALVLVGALLLVGGVATLVLRSATPRDGEAGSATAAAVGASSPPVVATPAPMPATSASEAAMTARPPPVVPTVPATPAPVSTKGSAPVTHPVTPPRQRPAPRPAASLRFAQPD